MTYTISHAHITALSNTSAVEIVRDKKTGKYRVIEDLHIPDKIWREVTSQ